MVELWKPPLKVMGIFGESTCISVIFSSAIAPKLSLAGGDATVVTSSWMLSEKCIARGQISCTNLLLQAHLIAIFYYLRVVVSWDVLRKLLYHC